MSRADLARLAADWERARALEALALEGAVKAAESHEDAAEDDGGR